MDVKKFLFIFISNAACQTLLNGVNYRNLLFCPTIAELDSIERKKCGDNHHRYYCMKTQNDTFIEFCGPLVYFEPKDGCPVYIGSDEFIYETCRYAEGCPPKQTTGPFTLKDMLQYEACFNTKDDEKKVTMNISHTSIERYNELAWDQTDTPDNISAIIVSQNPLPNSTPISFIVEFFDFIIAVIVIFVLVLANILVACFILLRIRNKDRKLKEMYLNSAELQEEETDGQVYDIVDESRVEETV